MKRRHACLLILALALAAAFFVRLFVGARFGWPTGDVLDLRLGRAVSAAAVGAGLGVSGALLQALLRNPLASPFVLGLANGAGLGVVVAIWIGYALDNPVLRQSATLPAALLGALLALVLVFRLGRRRGQVEPLSLVLVGVVLSAVFGAMTLFVLHLLPPAEMAVLTRWMMGSISDERSWLLIGLIAGCVGLGALFATALARPIDAMMLGDEDAVSVGVPLQRLRPALLLLAGFLAAAAVVLAGPLSFVGLIAPHLVRRAGGPQHRLLIPGSALLGAVLVVGADAFVNAFRVSGGRLPIGIFTALIGGPAFLWILRREWKGML